tara:strand:- start:119947 stop:120504 length:558 start_codon:yes stop_codon:yes gene_type:complete
MKVITILELAVRINIFLKLMNYGIGKMLNGQFYLKGQLPEDMTNIPLDKVDGFTLAWTFFGYSKGYILFIGASQIIGAILFLINRTKIIGGFILLPILMNIIVVNYYFGVAFGAMFSAIFYLLGVVWVLGRKCEEIKYSLKKLLLKASGFKMNWEYYLFVFATLAVLVLLEYLGITLFGYENRIV